jgi:Putative stress-induced transcription regulator
MSSETAPDGLALVQAFINSLDYPDGADAIATPESAATWLATHGTEAESLLPKDVKRLLDARETLRDFLEAHTGENVEPGVAVRLQELLGDAPLVPVLSAAGASLAPARPKGVAGFFSGLRLLVLDARVRKP